MRPSPQGSDDLTSTARILCAAVLVAAAAYFALVGSASAAPFTVGFDNVPERYLGEAGAARAEIIRVDVGWRDLAPSRPASPADPGDPAYAFGETDSRVRSATAAGFRVLLTVAVAPRWAEGSERPNGATEGTWKPDPKAFGKFGKALARRYSGAYTPGEGGGPLPKVDLFEPWNEPNLSPWLTPQYDDRRPVAVERYREMLNRFYEAVHDVNDQARVIGGSTGPFGDPPPNAFRTRPLIFARRLLCLRRSLKPRHCDERPKFDIYSHHPINLYGGPRREGQNRDDISGAVGMPRLTRVLRAAERHDRIATKGSPPLWVTEIWWETNPPDPKVKTTPAMQADYYQESFYLLAKVGVRAVILFQFVDSPITGDPLESYQSGVVFDNGPPKPSFQAVRFPFVADRLGGGAKMRVWTVPPASGALEVQARKDGAEFQTIRTLQAEAGSTLTTNVKLSGEVALRGVLNGEQTLVWTEGAGGGGGKVRRRGGPRVDWAESIAGGAYAAPGLGN